MIIGASTVLQKLYGAGKCHITCLGKKTKQNIIQ